MRVNQPPGAISKVFLLMLENRSFDHMLGFSGITGRDAATGQPTTADGLTGDESNAFGGTSYAVEKGADLVLPSDPGHEFEDVLEQLCGPDRSYPPGGPYPPIDNSGFVANYVAHGGAAAPGRIMRCFVADQLPVLNALAGEFAVCDRWFSSVPGPTWPNRLFALAGSSGGLDHTPSSLQVAEWVIRFPSGFSLGNGHIFGRLGQRWRIYRDGLLVFSVVLSGINWTDTLSFSERFASDLQDPGYPDGFTLIEPAYGNLALGSFAGGSSQHPPDGVTGGEALIKRTYEAIRRSPHWESSLLIVTWDEHGGFYDHVAPPAAVPPGDTPPAPGGVNAHGFAFDQYGPRVPAVVASAYTPRGSIDHRPHDHTSVLATLETVFELDPLTQRDRQADDLTPLAMLATARTDAPLTLPAPAVSPVSVPTRPRGPSRRAEPALPLPRANLWAGLHVAMQSDVDVSPPSEEPATRRRVRAIALAGDVAQARAYVAEVEQKLAARARA